MNKIAIVILADTTSFEGLGRVVNALEAAKEFKDASHPLRIVFDGAGTKWIGELENREHQAHALFTAVKDHVVGACGFCAGAFGVASSVEAARVPMLAEHNGHPSFRKLVAEGFQILTF